MLYVKYISIRTQKKKKWSLLKESKTNPSCKRYRRNFKENYECLVQPMATHASTLAWKIPWKEEPGRLQSMGSLRLGHDWAPSLSLFPFMHWRRKWQRTPVFFPGESQGRRSPMGCCLWGHTESDMTEVT